MQKEEEDDDELFLPPWPPRLPREASKFTIACLELLLLAILSKNNCATCRLSIDYARAEVPLRKRARLKKLPLLRGG